MIQLGSTVRCTLTGMVGVVTGRFEYLYGCVRLAVQQKQLKEDGSIMDEYVADEARFAVIAPPDVPVPAAPTGSSTVETRRAAPPARSTPAR